jgi:hypothetical protein
MPCSYAARLQRPRTKLGFGRLITRLRLRTLLDLPPPRCLGKLIAPMFAAVMISL